MKRSAEAAVVAAFRVAVARIRKRVAAWERQPASFDIVGAVDSFPWEASFEVMRPALARALLAAAKDGIAAAKKDEVGKVTVSELALEWAQFNAGELIVKIGRSQREAVRDIIAFGIRTNQTIPEIARELRDVVGVTPRDMRALRKMRDAMRKEGVRSTVMAARLKRRAEMMVRRRAVTIARNEVSAAITQGKLAEWGIAVADGRLPPTMHRKWQARDPCKMCRALARHRAMPLSQPFIDINGRAIFGPPAHPRCKCGIVLVPAPGGRFRKAAPGEVPRLDDGRGLYADLADAAGWPRNRV